MRFLSSSALASAPKLRLAANCSAAETIGLPCPPPAVSCPALVGHPALMFLYPKRKSRIVRLRKRRQPSSLRLRFGFGLRFGLAFLRLAAAFGGLERHALVLAARLGVFFLLRRQDFHRAAGLFDRGNGGLRGAPNRKFRL